MRFSCTAVWKEKPAELDDIVKSPYVAKVLHPSVEMKELLIIYFVFKELKP